MLNGCRFYGVLFCPQICLYHWFAISNIYLSVSCVRYKYAQSIRKFYFHSPVVREKCYLRLLGYLQYDIA